MQAVKGCQAADQCMAAAAALQLSWRWHKRNDTYAGMVAVIAALCRLLYTPLKVYMCNAVDALRYVQADTALHVIYLLHCHAVLFVHMLKLPSCPWLACCSSDAGAAHHAAA